MKKDIMKRTLAGMTAALTAASQLPAVFASADDPQLIPTGQLQSEYPGTLEGLYSEANAWFYTNLTVLDEDLGADLEAALYQANDFLSEVNNLDDEQEAEMMLEMEGPLHYNRLLDAYKAAKESLVVEPVTYDTKIEAVAPTCTEPGNIEYYIGSDDNYYVLQIVEDEPVYTPIDEDKVVLSPLGHDWGEPQWAWFNENEGASAFFKCSRDNEVRTLAATVEVNTIPATCDEAGKTTYTAKVVLDGVEYTSVKEVTIDALGHAWSEPEYKWGKNVETGEYECTASRTCANGGESEVETVTGAYKVITPATTKAPGLAEYTATFENEAFTVQTSTVTIAQLVPGYAEPVYTWSEDYKTCTGFLDCINGDDDEDITVTVNSTAVVHTAATCTAKGKNLYTAEFNDDRFETQTAIVEDIDATGHSYVEEPEFIWEEDNSACIAKFVCEYGDSEDIVEAELSTEYTVEPTCEEPGSAIITATVEFNGKTYTDEKEVFVEPLGHDWEVTWYWYDEDSAVAYLLCKNDGTEKAMLAKVTTEKTDATCTEAGVSNQVATIEIDGQVFKDYKTTELPIVPHSFENQDVVWTKTDDGYTATASRKCSECGVEESETVTANYDVIKEPTIREKGIGVYTAVFEDEDFETATKEVEIETLAPDYEDAVYVWSEDLTTVTATRVAKNGDEEDTVTEIAEVTSSETKAPSCSANGETTYVAEFENELFAKQEKTIANIEKLPHTYGTPIWSWTPAAKGGYTANIKLVCKVCGEVETCDAEVTSEKQGDVTLYTAVAVVDGVEYMSELTAKNNQVAKNPVVTYEAGEGAVKLNWEAVDGAEKYAVLGYQSGKWVKLGEGYSNSYTLDGLKAGKEYQVAVICKFDGKWLEDLSNAITVTPKAEEVQTTEYPTVTSIENNEKYHQVRISWTPVAKAQKYGVAAFVAGKWKILEQNIPGNVTTYTSPKLTEIGRTYKMLIVAKVGGEWDLSKMNSRVFEVTVL